MKLSGSALLLACAALALPALPGAAEPWVPPGKRLDFAILRNGEEIGRQTLAFSRADGELAVDTRVEIAVKVLFVTVHRFRRSARSVWRDGRVRSYTARTDDNGTKSRLDIAVRGDSLAIDADGTPRTAPRALKLREFWNIDILSETRVIDTRTGEVEEISVSGPQETALELGGKRIPARRYRLTGKVPRDLWYDRKGGLLQISRRARDGSTILTRRR